MLFSGVDAPAAETQHEVMLSPAGPWNLDATESGCALIRAFGPASRPVVLEMRRYRPGDKFQLNVDGEDLASLVTGHKLSVEYGDLRKDEDNFFQVGTAKRDEKAAVPSIFLSSALMLPEEDRDVVTPAMEEGVRQIALAWSGKRLVLATGSLGKPFAAMRTCTDALLRTWGLDPAVQNGLSRRTKPANVQALVRSLHALYPTSMLAQRKQGLINFRVLVDAQGKVGRCETMKSYNDPAFDALACKVIQRTRFVPALDKDGKPVESYYAEKVSYFIP